MHPLAGIFEVALRGVSARTSESANMRKHETHAEGLFFGLEMNYYPFHLGDYAAHTAHLEPMEDLAYRRMLDLYYRTESPLPEPSEIARLIRMKDHESTVIDILNEFFSPSQDGYRHVRCDAEIAKMQDKQAKAKASARASVNARSTNAQRTLNERSTDAELPTPTPTPTPITNNQEPITKEKDKAPRERAAPFALPDWINADHWNAWHSCPKRKKATDQQKQLAVDKLAAWKAEGVDYAAALENAAIGGWQGLFRPDQKNPMPGPRVVQINRQEALEARNRLAAEEWLRQEAEKDAKKCNSMKNHSLSL